MTLDSTSFITASTSAVTLTPRCYISKAGIDDGLPENPYLATVTSEAFPQVGGKILIYHPDKDFTLQKKGTVVLFNDFGYLFKLDLDDQDRAYVGRRRIDIKTHNKLTPAERKRQRDDPVQSELLFVPPATPEELIAAEYFYRPTSPETESEGHKEESHSDEEDPISHSIRRSPIEPIMATQTYSRLATHIARGNVTLPNIPPIFIPPPAPARPPSPPTRPHTPGGGGGGGGQPPAGGRGDGGGGGRGGGQPPAGGRGGQANPPAVPNPRLCRNPLEIFTGDREKADRFLSQLKCYYLANIGVPEFNSWIRKVVIACTYIQGPLIDKWVNRAVDWLSRLDPLIDNIEDVWDQFLDTFAEQFQDSQKGERARTGLKNIKMTWPLIDQYIQDFEQLAAEAGYVLGDAPTNRYFV